MMIPVVTLAVALLVAGPAAAQELALNPGLVGDGPLAVGGSDCAGGEIYDDGGAENGYSGNAALISSFEGVMQFTPAAYPGTYDTVCVGLVSLMGPTLDFEIEVRDDDGAGGTPGTLLGAVPVSLATLPGGLPCAFFEVDITSMGLNIASGNVFIGVRWNPMLFPSRFICADESVATPLHPGFVNFNNPSMWDATQTAFPAYRAKLVRAIPGVLASDADLSVLKTADVNPDDTVDFDITVTNNGPDPATNVVVTDDLPACTTYISDNCGGANVPPWTWNVGDLPVNTSVTCTITVDGSTCEGEQSNTAVATADQADPTPGDESSTATFTLGSVLEIPTLGRWGILALIGLLIGLGVWRLRSA
jgi:uncharacterized repeat protein (TIGR01451 family)